MIDFRARLTRLHDALRERYGVIDTQVIDIIVAAHLSPRTTLAASSAGIIDGSLPPFWLVLETTWLGGAGAAGANGAVDCSSPWFTFGGTIAPINLQTIRHDVGVEYNGSESVRLPKYVQARCGQPALWIEPHWDVAWLPEVDARTSGRFALPRECAQIVVDTIEQFCLRLRSTYPKMNLVSQAAVTEVRGAANEVLDVRFRERAPTLEPVPQALLWWIEIVQKTTTRMDAWDTIVRAMSSLRARLAWLRGKAAADDEETRDLERVIRDSVPYIWQLLIPQLADEGATVNNIKLPIAHSRRLPYLPQYLNRGLADGFLRYILPVTGERGRDGKSIYNHKRIVNTKQFRDKHGRWFLKEKEAAKLARYEERLMT